MDIEIRVRGTVITRTLDIFIVERCNRGCGEPVHIRSYNRVGVRAAFRGASPREGPIRRPAAADKAYDPSAGRKCRFVFFLCGVVCVRKHVCLYAYACVHVRVFTCTSKFYARS